MALTAVIPILDIRISEFAPDRDQATRAWAEHELQVQRDRHDAGVKADEEYRTQLYAAEFERLTELRVQAVKRGELYERPPPPPRYEATPRLFLSASQWIPSQGTYGYGVVDERRDPERPVLLPPGFRIDRR